MVPIINDTTLTNILWARSISEWDAFVSRVTSSVTWPVAYHIRSPDNIVKTIAVIHAGRDLKFILGLSII